MIEPVHILLWILRAALTSKSDLVIENVALRQQVAVLKGKRPHPRLHDIDRRFWVALMRHWSRWREALLIVRPETVIRWHRAGFRIFWRWNSRPRRKAGRPQVGSDVRALIRRMARENPSWGAPRIHGELLMLGINVSERTVQRYMPRRPPEPSAAERWKTFLRNHSPDIAAMDFFTVPTANFGVLYGLFFIHHRTRRILHANVTAHPTAEWIIQQLREAFPDEHGLRFLVHDRDAKFGHRVLHALTTMGVESCPTSYRSPWQNGIAERWVGSCRRELLDHIVPFGEAHLRRLLLEYVRYHNEDRPHAFLGKGTPSGRDPAARPSSESQVVALPRVGGIHHRYEWRDAA